jgi:ferredoxin
MKNCKYIYDKENCIGCGSCAALDSKNWKMQQEGKSKLLDSEETKEDIFEKEFSEKDFEKNLETAQSCPVNTIHIEKDNKKII